MTSVRIPDTLPSLEKAFAQKVVAGLSTVTDRLYQIRAEGLEHIDLTKPAVFAFKHRGWIDFFAATAFFRSLNKPVMIPVMEKMFKNRAVGSMLTAYGAVPIKRQQDEGYQVNAAEVLAQGRMFVEFIKHGGWYAYAPEGTGVYDAVGDSLHIRPLMIGSKYGQAFIVGTVCQQPHWLPGQITLRIAPYSANGKDEAEVKAETRSLMENLSGLEQKVKKHSSTRNH